MRAVWSFWTKPFQAQHSSVWASPKHHLLAWVLSVATARRHFPTTALYTDDEGARMLVDGIGLEFDHVSTGLNALRDEDPEWWVLGKLWTYRVQLEPFVHIDSDVFLWQPLPGQLVSADVLAQSPEYFLFEGDSWYRPTVLDSAIEGVHGWAPEEWRWYTSTRGNAAICCGIIGGNRVDFLNYYADSALRLVQHPANKRAWNMLDNRYEHCILIEQYLLSACVEYYNTQIGSLFHDIHVRYLFESTEAAFDPQVAARAGYTHMIGPAKKNGELAQRLENRVRRDYPESYARCLKYVEQA